MSIGTVLVIAVAVFVALICIVSTDFTNGIRNRRNDYLSAPEPTVFLPENGNPPDGVPHFPADSYLSSTHYGGGHHSGSHGGFDGGHSGSGDFGGGHGF